VAKTSQKFVFHLCETHILAWLDISMLYIIFRGFKKYQVWCQKLNSLGLGFTEKYLFVTKIDRKSVFQPHEAHVLSWLEVSVMYTNF
jgi:hypothetical protein